MKLQFGCSNLWTGEESMRAFQVAHLGNQALLIEGNVPVPHPGPGDLLIRVQAAGVTPTELLWYPTSHTQTGEDRAGAIPAHEFSGVITEVGNNAGSFAIGQEVFGMNDWFAEGALAEYCI
jgi:NADPH:quinone reductase-like Zn-dependent oxidoreductase